MSRTRGSVFLDEARSDSSAMNFFDATCSAEGARKETEDWDNGGKNGRLKRRSLFRIMMPRRRTARS